jgi:uncharacterized protein YebE (UPF0316 family)
MIWLIKFIIVVLFEFLYTFFRTININKIVEQKAVEAALLSGLLMILWITSLAIGIKSVMEGDIIMAIGYVVSSALGVYCGIKYENKLWKIIKKIKKSINRLL